MSTNNARTIYATDEDIAVRCGPDFATLCPADQVVAAATDGAFAAGDRWTLTSASTDFVARGAAAGQVAQLLKPTTQFRPQGTRFAVQSAAAGGLTLRRLGQVAGIGQQPSPAGGLTGVEFVIGTFGPQLERASIDLDRRFGIDPSVPGRSASNIRDLTPLRDAAVLSVLVQRYRLLGEGSESFEGKADSLSKELDALLAGLSIAWDRGGSTGRFCTRLHR